jgi:hypothetical protein
MLTIPDPKKLLEKSISVRVLFNLIASEKENEQALSRQLHERFIFFKVVFEGRAKAIAQPFI